MASLPRHHNNNHHNNNFIKGSAKISRYGPISLAFWLGWILSNWWHDVNHTSISTTSTSTTTNNNNVNDDDDDKKQKKISSFVTHLNEIPIRATAHVDTKSGKDVVKQQFIEPFVIPNLAGISIATMKQGQEVSLHKHTTMHEFFYVIKGSATFSIIQQEGNKEQQQQQHYHVEPGSFAYFAPPDVHGIQVTAGVDEELQVLVVGVIVEE